MGEWVAYLKQEFSLWWDNLEFVKKKKVEIPQTRILSVNNFFFVQVIEKGRWQTLDASNPVNLRWTEVSDIAQYCLLDSHEEAQNLLDTYLTLTTRKNTFIVHEQ